MKDKQLQHHQVNFDSNTVMKISVLLDKINSPANLGSIFRNADAFDVKTIWVHEDNENDLKSNRFKRTSRSTEKNITTLFYKEVKSVLNEFDGFKAGLEITLNSKDITEISKNKAENILLVLGNEKEGITENILNHLNQSFHIKMLGENTSLNVAQTLGIALYEIRR